MPGRTTKEQSEHMLTQFLKTLVFVCNTDKIKYVYFDSLSSFAPMILIRAALLCNIEFDLVMRDLKVHQIKLLKRTGSKTHVMFILRDYSLLLNFSVQQLYSEFVSQTTIPKARLVQEERLKDFAQELKQAQIDRVNALYEVLSITQSTIFKQFACDIVKSGSISSLAMKIFLTHYYQEDTIYSNGESNDAFIRKAYFGGHADIYKTLGQNTYVYDVNSLYAYCMRKDMPVGRPRPLARCEGMPLSELFGFVDAVIECPKSIVRPFLPVRTETSGVIYPTGRFQGVYFSEELLFAQKLGYKVLPIRALLFDRGPSPLMQFVDDFYQMRLQAKLENKQASQLLYK
uniref:DNA-directed DNA polymerase n=1 Tax=Zygnema circumcarinatum TaxID=35869 RepID=A0A6N0GXJ3_ZYGCR|nr:DNA-directed DNA polymerase [Zygnema circumcarinatum]QKQ14707.1 DNA-directed DNA polymerase [Zygnema circumcarinatum]WEL36350.1 DNA-directed DNA polymerase [Zygnema circumcarinatum]